MNHYDGSLEKLLTIFPQIVSAETILFLNLAIRTVTFDHSKYVCGHYSREETIQGRKVFTEIQCPISNSTSKSIPSHCAGRNFHENKLHPKVALLLQTK